MNSSRFLWPGHDLYVLILIFRACPWFRPSLKNQTNMWNRKETSDGFRLNGRLVKKPCLVLHWFNGRSRYWIYHPLFKFTSLYSVSYCNTEIPIFKCSLALSIISIPLSIKKYCPFKRLTSTLKTLTHPAPINYQTIQMLLIDILCLGYIRNDKDWILEAL